MSRLKYGLFVALIGILCSCLFACVVKKPPSGTAPPTETQASDQALAENGPDSAEAAPDQPLMGPPEPVLPPEPTLKAEVKPEPAQDRDATRTQQAGDPPRPTVQPPVTTAKPTATATTEQKDSTAPAGTGTGTAADDARSTRISLSSDEAEEERPVMVFPPVPPEYDPYGDADRIAAGPDADQLITLNFNDEPIASLLKALFGDTLKLNYILDKEVSGNITIVTKTPFPKKDLFDVILLVLKLNGFAVTRAGNYYLIIPTGDVLKYLIPTKTGDKAADLKPSERIITQVVPLKFLSTSEVSGIITPMKSDETQIITLDAANILIFTGPASNIRRMMEMIEVMDIETSQEEFRIFQIKYADANDILKTLQTLFQKKVGSKSVATQPRTPAQRPRPGDQRKQTESPGIVAVGGSSDEPVIIVDERSNSLIVFGSARDMEFIQKIIDIFDVDIYSHQEMFIYYVENAEAKDLKTILEDLYKGSQSSSSSKKSSAPAAAVAAREQAVESERPGQIVGDVTISVDERTNALIIQSTYRNYKILENMIQKLDVVPKQVLIEVLIVEVTLDDSMSLGFQWNLRSEGTVGDNTFTSTTSTEYGVGSKSGLNWTVFEPTRFNSILNTFASDSRIEILSNPHILCSNNMDAKIQIGDEVPTLSSQAVTQPGSTTTPGTSYNPYYTSQVEYLSTGIILSVKARVNEARMVSIEISQEVSEAQQNELADINSPTIRKRVLETSVTVRDNQTIVMGGLMSNKKTKSDQGIPLLSKIPFLRWLFGSESRETSKKELILFITPHVIGTPYEVYEKTMEFMDKLPRVEKLKEKNQ